jgi:hypothetical protein
MLFGLLSVLAFGICAADQTSRDLSSATDARQGMIEALKAQGPRFTRRAGEGFWSHGRELGRRIQQL